MNYKRSLFIVLVGIAAVLSGLAIGQSLPKKPNVLLPRGVPVVNAAHEKHALSKDPKVECVRCHTDAAKSKWASDRLVPPMKNCASCHRESADVTASTKVTKDCELCHGALNGKRPIRGNYPRPNVRFSHFAHSNQACRLCHGESASTIPNMKQCWQCHGKKRKLSRCGFCHLVKKDGRLITEFDGVKLIPPVWLSGVTHKIGWAGTHARIAGSDSQFCSSCHMDTFCQDCHTGKLRPRNIHPGDWITSHGISTRLDNPRCKGCHKKQAFCLKCHRRAGVAPDSPAKTLPAGGPGRYHKGKTARQLCRRAKYDVAGCMSCHSEGSCISCHAVIKPHPGSWQRKCKAQALRNRHSCQKCHTSDPVGRCE